jgi:hypothetical protein
MDEHRSAERIANDANSREIKNLIMETVDPKDKAILLILLKISDDLFRNTQVTISLSDKFEKHVEAFVEHAEQEMSLINQGRGFLRAMVIALTIVQALVIYIYTEHMEEADKLREDVAILKEYKASHIVHHEMEEKKK